jgi:hypothetical protein
MAKTRRCKRTESIGVGDHKELEVVTERDGNGRDSLFEEYDHGEGLVPVDPGFIAVFPYECDFVGNISIIWSVRKIRKKYGSHRFLSISEVYLIFFL